MTTELYAALFMALFAPVLAMASATAVTLSAGGLSWGLGNRHEQIDAPDWAVRFKRSHQNFMENLPTFLGVVLIAHILAVNDTFTSLAAIVFVAARLAFVLLYTAGVTFLALRTISYFTSLGAIGVIAWRILA